MRYFGKTHFSEGEWCGIELDEQDGRHDGTFEGVRYFTCHQGYGIFAPVNKVELVEAPTRGAEPDTYSKSGLKQPRFKSKLAKPKAIVKPLSKETSDAESVGSQASSPPKAATSKRSKLPTGIVKPTKLTFQEEVPSKSKKSKSHKVDSRNVTFSLEEDNNTERAEESFDYEVPEVTTPSRVDPISALTLAYDLESSGSDIENRAKKQCQDTGQPESKDKLESGNSSGKSFSQLSGEDLNLTFTKSESQKPAPEGALVSPIPDLLTPSAYHVVPEPSGDAGEAMSESEAEEDLEFLAQSSASQASSLGVLGDTQLANNSLLNNDLRVLIKRQQSKDSIDIPEKDLDSEIAGVATPEVQSEVEMSSSTISCDSLQQPNLEPDLIRSGHDQTFDPVPEHSSTQASGDEQTVSEEGSCSSSNASSQQDLTTQGRSSSSPKKAVALLHSVEEYPEQIRTDDDVEDKKVSIELAKTAVLQYADLVKSAEQEQAHKEAREREKAAKKARLEELRAKRKSQDMEVDVSEEVLIELRDGYTNVARPLSMLSSCSTDTGICMDSSFTSSIDSDGRRERPLSMFSSASSDAGRSSIPV